MPRYFSDESKKKKILFVLTNIVFLILLLVGYFFLNRLSINNHQINEDFQICSLSTNKSCELVLDDNKNEKIYEINDYLFYGEYLNLYHSEYSIFEKDELTGKSFILNNLCSNKSYTYTNMGYLDGLIKLDLLEDGFYSIYVNNNNELYRVYYNKIIEDEFFTIRRNNQYKKIEIIANKNFIDSNDKTLKENYLYLNVSTVSELPEDYYDIVIDPSYVNDLGTSVSRGKNYNGLNESEETFKAAEIIKEELEKHGLKVLITRNTASELKELYGKTGRLNLAYDSKSRYFIELSMNVNNYSNYYGLSFSYSSFASNKMAVSIKNYLANNTKLVLRKNNSNNGIDGVFVSNKDDGYDSNMKVREAGGKATNAGNYSESSKLNAPFAFNNRKGMMALEISFINLTNISEVELWKEEYQEIAKQTALALLDYLDISNDTTN